MSQPPALSTFQLGVVVLAAGMSRRMGRPKMLLPWGDTCILGRILSDWCPLAKAVLVVTHPDHHDLHRAIRDWEIPGTQLTTNPTPDQGMFSSIQHAARWSGWPADLSHWAVALGDQPHLRADTRTALLAAAQGYPGRIVQPARLGRFRHPVLLPRVDFLQLARSDEPHLHAFLLGRGPQRHAVEMDDPGLDLDIDEPADYQRALQFLA